MVWWMSGVVDVCVVDVVQSNEGTSGFCVLIVSVRVLLCRGLRGCVMYEVCRVIKVTSVTLPLIVY